jgi:fructose-specific phosphotransferase system IIC component
VVVAGVVVAGVVAGAVVAGFVVAGVVAGVVVVDLVQAVKRLDVSNKMSSTLSNIFFTILPPTIVNILIPFVSCC